MEKGDNQEEIKHVSDELGKSAESESVPYGTLNDINGEMHMWNGSIWQKLIPGEMAIIDNNVRRWNGSKWISEEDWNKESEK